MANVVMQHGSPIKRTARRPRHNFSLKTRPFQIQPFMLAPVLPGETMKSAILQSRVITDPITNPIMGWWKEYYFYYVKIRDLADADTLEQLFVDLDADISSLNEAASTIYNHFAGAPNYMKMCTRAVVEAFFRHEGETWDTAALDGLPLAKVIHESFANRAVLQDEIVSLDLNVDLDSSGTITADEIDRAREQWEFLKQYGMQALSFEDYLAAQGMAKPQRENFPEELRYERMWQYPSNTIDPSDGSPSSAVSWSVNMSADKDRLFKEPGFLVGLTCTRPKVQFKNYDGNASDLLTTAIRWMAGNIHGIPADATLARLAETAGPLSVVTDLNGYALDMRDLFEFGDQFRNYANTETGKNIVDLPLADLSREYVSETDIDALFVDAVGGNKYIHEDGIVMLSILGRIIDNKYMKPLSAA